MSTRWFVAELVEEITVEDDARNVVHQNLVLIRASSPDEAYEKANRLGKDGETSYANPSGKTVKIQFRGLSHLDEVHEEIEDGAEIMFHSKVGVSERRLQSLVKPREGLRAFLPPQQAEGPDYTSREIIDLLEREYGVKRLDVDPSPTV
jgi:hypothetical protein